MRQVRWLRMLAGVAMSASMLSGVAAAQENQAAQQDADEPADVLQVVEDEEVVFVAKARAVEGWWLGLQTEAATDPTLRKQLNLGDRGLIVVEVLPESPASKAGLQVADILIQAGEAELRTIEDLQSAVGKQGGKSFNLMLLRDGKKVSVEATPARRPPGAPRGAAAEFDVEPKEFNVEINTAKKAIDELVGELHKKGAPGAMQFRFVGPGVVGGTAVATSIADAELPKDVKITISRQGKEPAQITVKRGDKTWETTADKLGEIPEDLRGHVHQMLGHGGRWAYRVDEKLPADVRERFMKWTVPLPPGGLPPGAAAGSRVWVDTSPVESARVTKSDAGLAEVQREVAKLRDELAALRKEISGRAGEREVLEKLLRRLLDEQR